jgi:competence protein ComEA
MFKKLVLAVATVIMTMGFAFANVDVNKADQAALDGVKGIGPTMSKAILAERKKGGDFKDWEDFQSRVKGIGEKNSEKFSQAGLTVGGVAKPGTKPATSKPKEKTADKLAKADATAASATSKSADKKEVKSAKP